MTLDTERVVEYNKEEIIIRQDGSMTADAVLHRFSELPVLGVSDVVVSALNPTTQLRADASPTNLQRSSRSGSTFTGLTWIGSSTRFSMSCAILVCQITPASWRQKSVGL